MFTWRTDLLSLLEETKKKKKTINPLLLDVWKSSVSLQSSYFQSIFCTVTKIKLCSGSMLGTKNAIVLLTSWMGTLTSFIKVFMFQLKKTTLRIYLILCPEHPRDGGSQWRGGPPIEQEGSGSLCKGTNEQIMRYMYMHPLYFWKLRELQLRLQALLENSSCIITITFSFWLEKNNRPTFERLWRTVKVSLTAVLQWAPMWLYADYGLKVHLSLQKKSVLWNVLQHVHFKVAPERPLWSFCALKDKVLLPRR